MKIVIKSPKKRVFIWLPTKMIINRVSLYIILKGLRHQYPMMNLNVEDVWKALLMCHRQELIDIHTKDGKVIYISF